MCEDTKAKTARASLQMRTDRNGNLVPTWYGRFSVGTKIVTRSLGVSIEGNPPTSGRIADEGDEAFEVSRAKAMAVALEMCREERGKYAQNPTAYMSAKAEEKKRTLREIPITRMVAEYDRLEGEHTSRKRERSSVYAGWKRGVIESFVRWWRESRRPMRSNVLDITDADAREFVDFLSSKDENGKMRKTDTVRRMKAYVSALLDRLLPNGTTNPFRTFNLETIEGEETVHREPLTEEEVGRVIEIAGEVDPLARDLIVTGACTAMRRGDVCRLRWTSVDMGATWTDNGGNVHKGVLRVKTRKTGAKVALPIFGELKKVLDARLADRADGAEFVFPEAERLIRGEVDEDTGKHRQTSDQITRRIKKVFALALADKVGADIEDAVEADKVTPLRDCLDKVLKAVDGAEMGEDRRKRMVRTLKLYASGETFNSIADLLGLPKSGISYDLHKAEELADIRFVPIRPNTGNGIKAKIKAVTRKERTVGIRSASVYDFHALRTTFATLASKHGVPPEVICLFTGHATTKTLQAHYNRVTGVDMAGVIAEAMPTALTDDGAPRLVADGGEVARLSRAEMFAVAKTFTPEQVAFIMQLTPDLLKRIQNVRA